MSNSAVTKIPEKAIAFREEIGYPPVGITVNTDTVIVFTPTGNKSVDEKVIQKLNEEKKLFNEREVEKSSPEFLALIQRCVAIASTPSREFSYKVEPYSFELELRIKHNDEIRIEIKTRIECKLTGDKAVDDVTIAQLVKERRSWFRHPENSVHNSIWSSEFRSAIVRFVKIISLFSQPSLLHPKINKSNK